MLKNKLGHRFIGTIFVTGMLLMAAIPVQAYFVPSTLQAATLVLGEPNFTTVSAVTTQTGMYFPQSVAVDPTTQKVFVADMDSNRVLRFASLASLVNGAAAEAVLGQTNFTSSGFSPTRSTMDLPSSVFVDAAGRLWVADQYNSRVLRFDNASALGSGANASAELGQTGFTTNVGATTKNGLKNPSGVFVDSAGRLWVADSSNSRVLRYDAAASKPNGGSADGVLGQPNFTSSSTATTQKGMAYPYGVTVDAAGRLWVADMINNRVLRFDGAASKANGTAANGVLGQTTFTSNVNATTQKGLFEPTGVTVSKDGHLYVADRSNHRIMVYTAAAGLANGANASFVLGHMSFTSNAVNEGGLDADTLNTPYGVFYDPVTKVLLAADTYNHRVLMYGKPDIYATSRSVAANDGWVLETTPSSSVGGTKNAAGLIHVGNNANNRQYRGVLYFDTSALPDNAIIHAVSLVIRKASVVGTDPLTSFVLVADMKKGTFGTAALQATDFQAAASASSVGHFVSMGGGLYQLPLPANRFNLINLTGATQFRLRFTADVGAAYDNFFAGDAVPSTNRPSLTVEYSLP